MSDDETSPLLPPASLVAEYLRSRKCIYPAGSTLCGKPVEQDRIHFCEDHGAQFERRLKDSLLLEIALEEIFL